MKETGAAPPAARSEKAPLRRVAVVADDLIWATRLSTFVKASGAEPAQWRPGRPVESAVEGSDGAVVDLAARALDPFAVIRTLAAAGIDVVSVGQHEDLEARGRALEAGASRVWTYNQVHRHGPTLIGRWVNRG